MKKNRNKTLALIWTLALVMMGGGAFGQRPTSPHVVIGGNVYGGGNLAPVAGNTSVLIDQDTATVTDVYGGGAFANVGTNNNNTTTVTILKGIINGNIYGGGLGKKQEGDDPTTAIPAAVNGVVTVNIGQLTGSLDGNGFAPSTSVAGEATIRGSVYGCNNANGTPKDNVTVNIYKTIHTATDSATFVANSPEHPTFAIDKVFGGGNEAHYLPVADKKTTVHVWTCDNTIRYLYGGGNAADVGGNPDDPDDPGIVSADTIVIDGGRIEWVFGGGNGEDPDKPAANIYGDARTTFRGGDVTYFFGGSNTKGNITGNKSIYILNDGLCSYTNHIAQLYGGNNLAPITGNAGVNLTMPCPTGEPCKIDYLFGGSRQADISGNVVLNVYGGLYDYVFGGNNLGGTISGNVTLNLYGGTINEAAFGGNNEGGGVNGKITVNLMEKGNCSLVVHNIYGGGYLACYKPTYTVGENESRLTPEVNIIHGTVSKKAVVNNGNTTYTGGYVFGGGYGTTAVVTSNPKVRVGYDATMSDYIPSGYIAEADRTAIVDSIVFGGGDLANVAGYPTVTLQHDNSSVSSLFGGGNRASVGGTTVSVLNGTVKTGVYGGCNESGTVGGQINSSDPDGNTATLPFDGTIEVDVKGDLGSNTGGTIVRLTEAVYGGGKGAATETKGDVTVTIGEDSNPTIYSDVYGGSALGKVNDATANPRQLTKVDFKNGTLNGTIYGGGMGALDGDSAIVNGDVQVDITTGSISGGIYGGCNLKGGVAGGITLNVDGGTIGANNARANIHGGGYGNATASSGDVTVNFGQASSASEYPKLYGDLYGGSGFGHVNASTSNTTMVNILNGEITGDVYGGGLGESTSHGGSHNYEALVKGNVEVYFGKTIGETLYGKAKMHTYTSGENTRGGRVFGCNNANGTPRGTVAVTINSTDQSSGTGNNKVFAIQGVYGGGNLANYTPGDATTTTGSYPTVTINNCLTSVRDVFGGGNAAAVTKTNVVVNGGDINRVFAGGNGTSGHAHVGYNSNVEIPGETTSYGPGTANVTVKGGSVNQVFGGSNSSGLIRAIGSVDVDKEGSCDMVIGEVYGGGNEAAGKAGVITIGCTGGTNEGIGDVYGGAKAAAVTGDITLNITGGKIGRVFGGNNVSGAIDGDITVNVEWTGSCPKDSIGYVYGGGNQAPYIQKTTGHPSVNIYNGTVSYNVYGGGLGNTATVTGTPTVTIGDMRDGHETNVATVFGDVYGGGDLASVTGGTSVTIQKAGTTATNVFGGGNKASVSGATSVAMTNGTVTALFGGGNEASVGSSVVNMSNGSSTNVYGGGNKAGVDGTAQVTVSGNSTISDGLFGGCNTSGTVTGNINVSITGGTIGADGTPANVHGGGYGENTKTGGNVEVTINQQSGENPPAAPVIWGDVYGGSALGSVNSSAATPAVNNDAHTYVTLTKGTVHGDIYGGGLGRKGSTSPAVDPIEAKVWSPVQVTVNGGTVIGSVYGCNNKNGAPQSTVNVDIYDTDHPGSGYALGKVFGGGNAADYNGKPLVTVHNCDNSIEYVYGGGNAANVKCTDVTVYGGNSIAHVFGGCYGANVSEDGTDVKIYGGTIDTIYGGNNESGTITGDIKVLVDKLPEHTDDSCAIHIKEVYGGGNKAASHAGQISIGYTGYDPGERINYVYGGANRADVTGPINLTIREGRIDNVFGGNNNSGNIIGDITVNIERDKDSVAAVWEVGNVYGGGNHAAYGGSPDVNIKAGTVSGNVYGGGNDITTDTQQNPCGVAGSNVEMTGGAVLGGLYGGCNLKGTVIGNSVVNIMGGEVGSSTQLADSIVANVFGGGLGENTKVNGNVTVTISRASGEAPTIYGDVYGGSALGQVNTGSSDTTTVNILDGTLMTKSTISGGFTTYTGGNVFGGGLGQSGNADKGKVNGKVVVNIGAGTPNPLTPFKVLPTGLSGNATIGGNVYGCNNSGGSPQDTVTVNVFQTAHTAKDLASYLEDDRTYAIANVFGGGNEADYSPAAGITYVNIYTCDNTIGRLFGGGNAANTPEIVTHIQGGRFFQVFGGGNGERGQAYAANVNGDVTLNLHGGNIGENYGGSNQNGAISGDIHTNVLNDGPCESVTFDEFFCGGYAEDVFGDLVTTIACSDAHYTSLYGGCNQANVYGNIILNLCGGTYTNVFGGSKGVAGTNGISADILDYTSEYITEYNTAHPEAEIQAGDGGNVTLNLYGGTIENVYGGSNINGNIEGNITVNVIDSLSTSCPLYITNIYGGSNLTDYVPDSVNHVAVSDPDRISPVVNLVHAKYGISGNVYGGSKGNPNASIPTKLMTNPLVNIGYDATSMNGYIPATYLSSHPDWLAAPRAIVAGSVFGGGDAAKVVGNTAIFLRNRAKVFGNVYGGGNMGEVTGNTKVIVNGANQ